MVVGSCGFVVEAISAIQLLTFCMTIPHNVCFRFRHFRSQLLHVKALTPKMADRIGAGKFAACHEMGQYTLPMSLMWTMPNCDQVQINLYPLIVKLFLADCFFVSFTLAPWAHLPTGYLIHPMSETLMSLPHQHVNLDMTV